MLITHVKPNELWGKTVVDANGNVLGEVVAIVSRRGVLHKVVVRRSVFDARVRVAPAPDSRVDGDVINLPPRSAEPGAMRHTAP